MKPVFANFNLKKSASVLAAAALLSFGSANVQAAPSIIEKIISPAENQVNINFVGSTDNSMVFHVKFENKTGEKFYLIVKNDAGEIVYQNSYTDSLFERNVRILDESSDIHPTFVIRTASGQVERKFSVANKISENVVVTAL
jgi:ATP-dependent protease HslVU (ClpYQ) peptidase subunit